MKNSINEQYEKDKNDRVKSYQDSIDESATHIRAIGNDEDIDELEQILDYKLDYSKTIKELVDELEKIFYKVRAIELKAQERIDIKNRNKIYKLNPRDISILKEYAVDGSLPDGLRRGPC